MLAAASGILIGVSDVALKALRAITMMKGTMVQTTSTTTDSWKLAALWPTDLRCFQIE